MAIDETLGRALERVQEELLHNPLQLWYLSYADETNFRGGVYLLAFGPVSAAMRSRAEGLSPGGQVMMVQVPEENYPEHKYWNRLLTKEDVQAANPNDECKTIAEFEAEEE
jgi:hypothetical protein